MIVITSIKKILFRIATSLVSRLLLLTAGEDQLPQERANVTNGSDSSKPNTPRVAISSCFAPFERVLKRSKG